MKALNLKAVNELIYEELPSPQNKAGEVLVQIKACGICGSDIPRVMTKGTYHFPTVVGHEFAGLIVKAGEGVDQKLVGKKAAVFPLLPCFSCEMCKKEQYASCADYNYFGSRCDGGFAQFLAVPLWNLVLADDNADYEELAMTEPCAVALHALNAGKMKKGDTVAIVGAGPIGVMIGQWVKIKGGKPILIDVDPRKIKFAQNLGFELCFAGGTAEAAAFIKNHTGGAGADVCIEAAGFASALEGCLYGVRPFGSVVAMGNPASDMNISQKAYWEILRKQIALYGTWNSAYGSLENDWKDVIKALEKRQLNLKPLITHRYKLSDGRAPFDMMAGKTEFYSKVMYVMEDK